MDIRKFSYLLLIVSTFLLGDCSKNVPRPVIPVPEIVDYPDTCYLTSKVEVYLNSSTYSYNYSYNDKHQVTSVSGTSPQGPFTITYSYAPNGNLLSEANSNGETVAYTYDSENRLIQKDLSPYGTKITLSYNDSGQMKRYAEYPKQSESGSARSYDYPNATTRNFSRSSISFFSAAVGRSYTYEYDNHPTPIKYFSAGFNGTDNNATKIIETSYYSTPAVTGTSIFVYTYNNKGYPVSRTSNGYVATYTYDCP